mmetsp:Transcript_25182/g.29146  ORF Transcript_25182/g.29146 Transcript_25182/m.29146 type:complete len:152 (+) Transcript_25182:76-531(+)
MNIIRLLKFCNFLLVLVFASCIAIAESFLASHGLKLSFTTFGGIERTVNHAVSSLISSSEDRYYSNFHSRTRLLNTFHQDDQKSNNDESNSDVQVGSKEYYSGFISRDINEEPEERITGDAVLLPTFKFVGGFAVVLIGLTFVFLVSNDLI